MPSAIAVRHVAFEDLGTLAGLLDQRGYTTRILDAGVDPLVADLASEDLLVVLGGPIGAYEEDRYPFLLAELRFIERALAARARVLGICLGAQLLARVLGARVFPAACKEIGFAPLELTAEGRRSALQHLGPERLVLHWHGDTFDLPRTALHLASTALTPNQAFAHGAGVLALQFHLEVSPASFERWLIGHAAELAAAGIGVNALRAAAHAHALNVAQAGARVLAAWLDQSAP
jgi:GMP synthase (glutamine-hydrolysing)